MSNIYIGDVEIPTNEFAIAGSAWLGIKKAGKTYGCKGVAEQLMEQGIPIIVFDAIGVWRYLKTPGAVRGARGYEVVVAGGEEPDIPLTPDNTAELVRAAMRSNVSLIIDLYDPKLSKADWGRIVRAGFHTLLYENKKYGSRYVILEEAAEFVPQQPRDGDTFAAVEKTVRMGGNVGLGVALVTPRAQEINKSVLDLCDNLVLMRQRGSHAIGAVQKWMDRASPDTADKVATSLSKIKNGQCWVWPEHLDDPVYTQTKKIKSFHPDRTQRNDLILHARKPINTTEFVSKMLADLPKVVEEKNAKDPVKLQARIKELEKELARKLPPAPAPVKALEPAVKIEEVPVLNDADRKLITSLTWEIGNLGKRIVDLATDEVARLEHKLQPVTQKLLKLQMYAGVSRTPLPTGAGKVKVVIPPPPPRTDAEPNGELQPVDQKILNSIAEMELLKVAEPNRKIVAFMSGYTNLTSTGFVKAIGRLRTANHVRYPDSDSIAFTDSGRALAVFPEAPRTSEEVQKRVCDLLGDTCSKILAPLIAAYPNACDRMDVANAANYTNLTSTGFVKMIGRLRSLGFVEYPDTKTIKAASVLFIE